MSKPYQHHDETADQGKAEPKPKRPTQNARRRWNTRNLAVDMALARARGQTTLKCCLFGHGNGRSVA